jgi:ribonuclease P/MRP protein subunit POP1
MAPSSQVAGQKRKVAFDRPALTSQARKRQKNQDARTIPIQRGTSLPSNGDLNIASFIKAREFEIGALDKSMRKSRKALMSRAFQQVPRHMRRRTASHNAKKVPRRLRRRAEREVSYINTKSKHFVLTTADQDGYR